MVRAFVNRQAITTFIVLGCCTVAAAASIEKMLADTESRRRTAENSVREIKAKASASVEDVRMGYTAAADGQNAWLDQVCKGLEESAPASDVAPAARTAASALVDWVAIRNRALAVPVMANDTAEAVRASIARDLTEIANTSWKSARGEDPQKRTKRAAALRERLRWRSWEDLQ